MTRPSSQDRPKRPKCFPLTAHGCGQWCKVIGGKRYYFGKWDDPDAALAKFRHDFPYLQAGVEVPVEAGGLQLRDLLNAFDDEKAALLDQGRIGDVMYSEYLHVAIRIRYGIASRPAVRLEL